MATGLHPRAPQLRAAGLRMTPHMGGGDKRWPRIDPREAWAKKRPAIDRDEAIRRAQKAVASTVIPLLTNEKNIAAAKAMQSLNPELVPNPDKVRALNKSLRMSIGKPEVTIRTLR